MGNLCGGGLCGGPIEQIIGQRMGFVVSTSGRTGMCVERHSKDKRFSNYLPITKCNTKVHIVDSIAFLDMEQKYINLSKKKIAEVQYKIPIEKTNIISKLTVTMGKTKIETQIEDREEAEQKYKEAKGHAVKLDKDEDEDQGVYSLKLKNVPAGKEISVKF